MKTIKFILINLDHFRGLFYFCLVIAFFDGVVSFAIPILLAEFTKTNFTIGSFWQLLPSIVSCFVLSLVFQWILRKWGESLAKHYSNHLKLKLFKIIEHLPIYKLVNFHSGYIISIANRVADSAGALVFTIIWLFAYCLAVFSLFMFYSAKESILIALFNLFIFIFFIFISTIFSKKMIPIANLLNIKQAKFSEKLIDLMSNLTTIKKLNIYNFAEQSLAEKVQETNQEIVNLQNFHANRWFTLHAIYGIAFMSTVGFVLYQISIGYASASILILFVSAFTTLRNQIERMSEFIKDVLEIESYVGTLNEIISDSQSPQNVTEGFIWQKIEIKDIAFSYDTNTTEIIVPEFTINLGEKVCITGESGQGKSTFLNIIAGLLPPKAGSISIDSKTYKFEALPQIFSFVSQEVELFNLSIKENLCLGKNIEDNKLFEYFDELALSDWYQSLPQGLATLVGEKGVKLSSGQKQRLNILRSVLLDRPVILLDEPTSHLDNETEHKVVQFLAKHLANKTVVFVTHREAVKKLCDKFYWFRARVLERV